MVRIGGGRMLFSSFVIYDLIKGDVYCLLFIVMFLQCYSDMVMWPTRVKLSWFLIELNSQHDYSVNLTPNLTLEDAIQELKSTLKQ